MATTTTAAAEISSATGASAVSASTGQTTSPFRSSEASATGETSAQNRGLAIGTPMRAFLERLATVGSLEDCPWRGYLPEHCQSRLGALAPTSEDPGATSCSSWGGLATQLLQNCPIEGHVLCLARDSLGCRRVQQALEDAETDAQREALVGELRGHVWEALQCPHANHVLQKVVVTLPPRSVQFVIDELSARGFSQAARHKYGCRIVQRLIEQCPHTQTGALVECLLSEVSTIARNQYGNYVLQNLVEHGSDENRRRIARVLLADIVAFGRDPYAVAVVGAALAHFPHDDRVATAEALLEEHLIVSMACSRLGHHCVIRLLEALPEARRGEALQQLAVEAETLQFSRFGQMALQNLEVELSSGDLAAFKQLQVSVQGEQPRPSHRRQQMQTQPQQQQQQHVQQSGRRQAKAVARAAGA